jgi:hypothetical protein
MRKINRNQAISYIVIFISIFLLTFFWLDHRYKGTSVYRDAPMSREKQIITERYRIKRLENRIRDLRSGEYAKRMQTLGRGDLEISDDMIRQETIEAEKKLKQAKKRLAGLIRK